MKKTCKRHKGFTLLELMIAMGISSLLLLVLYYAYFLAQTFFYMGTDTIQEQTYVRNLFSKISEDLQFANRLNSLGNNCDDLEFEIFNRTVIDTDASSNDKTVEGNTIAYSTKSSGDSKYIILMKKVDKYEWVLKFGHSQKPNDNEYPLGYPDDMRDPNDGKRQTETGEEEEVLEQVDGNEFLMNTIQFIPYDQKGEKIESASGYDYSSMKASRSIRIEVEYLLKGDYGDTARLATRKKTATANILFISFSMLSTSTEEVMINPAPGIFNMYCLGDVPVTSKNSASKYLPCTGLNDFQKIKISIN
ncbi:MAG: hypothetical protein A2452_02505 [Candidatus Firestonebacteria bacterium RIFOXYC2_FULL_39_67]|nr:MAG: hypothetical protein A2536_02045 [Candidatus Firestonebacteria bacterium RIFOXYD2_FULL_39_29]OGF55193.1 MAG: hypothetical protein A2452_02505 [Candidatus Firestonebacteria bacterium RIFOXYC2_FULL_39_67]OGF57858.1 MAG: hypothetical protein A2497_01960 [Candidatus Firestonebacteria bacterium RifOxyC12_full_39_7]